MKIKTSHIILAGLFATATALPAATTIIDGFGTLALAPNNTDLTDAGGSDWYNQDGTQDGNAFAGVMTSTTLTVNNTTSATNSRLYETPTARIVTNTHETSILRFSFDYNVTAGSPSIYFHLKGVDVTGASPDWNQQLVGRGGAAFHSEVNNTETYNLFTGLDNAGGNTSGSNAWAYNGGNTNLTGMGTISGEINLATHGTYTDLSDYEYLAVAFAVDFTAAEAATVEISNFTLAVPEPSSTALLGLGGLALMLRRKRS